ncbi:MAG: DUF4112 domain-containing protein [Chloracidobacterium sp.]|nr:DUF4112 domain-containing protein [Chloracidobacterium sp.]
MSDITPQEKQIRIEKGLDELARYLDGLFRVPGTEWRFGLDALIGLIPNVGDTLTFLPSVYILFAGVRYGVPKITLLRMAINVGLDYLVGSIPLIGDAFDFVWKANQQNMNLIRTRAAGHGAGSRSDYIFVLGLVALLFLILIASLAASVYVIGSIFWEIFTLNI